MNLSTRTFPNKWRWTIRVAPQTRQGRRNKGPDRKGNAEVKEELLAKDDESKPSEAKKGKYTKAARKPESLKFMVWSTFMLA